MIVNSLRRRCKLVMLEFLQRSPYLRVINLEGIEIVKEKKKDHVCSLPHETGEMVHLQYLGVRCRGLKKVPSSIGNLRNLQTIDVRGMLVRSLPESLWKVKTLRHVLGDELAFPRSTGDLKLMHTLEAVTIDHLDDDWCSTAAAWKRGKEFRLRYLHRLHVAKLDAPNQRKALKSVLEGLSSLEALILSGNHIPVDLFAPEASDEATASCLKHVEYLKLDGQLHLHSASSSNTKLDYSRLHSWLVDLTHLVLRSTKIGQDFIHWIGKLPALAELELLEGSYEDDKLIFCTDEFNSLTQLRIFGLDKLEEIFVPDATTRRKRNKAINMDVPDHVKVVTIDKHCPSEQQPIAGTAGSNQQTKGGEDDQTSSNDHPSHSHTVTHETTTTTTHGGNYQITEEDGNPSPAKLFITEMILEAVSNNNSSITSVTNYIKDAYVAICLDHMVQSGKLRKEKTNDGRYKYVLDRTEPHRD